MDFLGCVWCVLVMAGLAGQWRERREGERRKRVKGIEPVPSRSWIFFPVSLRWSQWRRCLEYGGWGPLSLVFLFCQGILLRVTTYPEFWHNFLSNVTACLDLKTTVCRFLQPLVVPVEAEDHHWPAVRKRFPLHPPFHQRWTIRVEPVSSLWWTSFYPVALRCGFIVIAPFKM